MRVTIVTAVVSNCCGCCSSSSALRVQHQINWNVIRLARRDLHKSRHARAKFLRRRVYRGAGAVQRPVCDGAERTGQLPAERRVFLEHRDPFLRLVEGWLEDG